MTYCFSFVVFFFKQKTAYEMRISDWSSDVCSSDLKNLLLNCEERRLRHIEQDEFPGIELPGLASQFAADRTASAGDQHYLARDRRGQEVQVGSDRFAPDQVFDLALMNVLPGHLPLPETAHSGKGTLGSARVRERWFQ